MSVFHEMEPFERIRGKTLRNVKIRNTLVVTHKKVAFTPATFSGKNRHFPFSLRSLARRKIQMGFGLSNIARHAPKKLKS